MRHHCSEQDSQFQHTAARRRLPHARAGGICPLVVSTHSRPKAAAPRHPLFRSRRERFNTQPPEGGCERRPGPGPGRIRFNTQPPEGGCPGPVLREIRHASFNTQPPEGGCATQRHPRRCSCWFQHTAARRRLPLLTPGGAQMLVVSTHSRPKAAAKGGALQPLAGAVSTHSRPKAAASVTRGMMKCLRMFQHTAARRRLPAAATPAAAATQVSTHSRPKAAAPICRLIGLRHACFNTQPPEGGCAPPRKCSAPAAAFQHTAARRRLQSDVTGPEKATPVSTHSRPKAAAAHACGARPL